MIKILCENMWETVGTLLRGGGKFYFFSPA